MAARHPVEAILEARPRNVHPSNQRQLARALNVHPTQLNRYLRGRVRPAKPMQFWTDVARVLGVPVEMVMPAPQEAAA